MTRFEKFSFKTLDAIKEKARALDLDLPFSDDTALLSEGLDKNGIRLPNRLAVQPMEGCDSAADGRPTEAVYRRYERFASGGAGLIWLEACAVCEEGRANPRQMWIHEGNKEAFKELVDFIRKSARESRGQEVFLVLQLTHSGRYSRPGKGLPAVIAAENPYLDPFLPEHYRIITDEEIEALEDQFLKAAELAAEAGFDAVDVTACHRYLNSELLSAYTREGKYGGSFENLTRFLRNTVRKIKTALKDEIVLATRINAFDEIPYPYGFGTDKDNYKRPDFSEIRKLSRLLEDDGLKLIDVTGGNPYYNPHVNRPADLGFYKPPFHPLENVEKLIRGAKAVKDAADDLIVTASGLSWLRQFGANLAAGAVGEGYFDLAGFGRQSLAYPSFAADILDKGGMDPGKVCISCSRCTVMMRDGMPSGCPIRDGEVFLPIYREGRAGRPQVNGRETAEHL